MDKAAHAYGWFLLVVTGLSALARLLRPQAVAEMESAKLANARTRRNRRIFGLVGIVGSPLFLVAGFFYPLKAWLWFAVVVGFVSGVDQYVAAKFWQPKPMLVHARIFGWVYLALAISIYFLLIRH